MDKKQARPPENVEVFYSTQDGSYLYKLGGEFVTLKLSDVRRHMRALGLREDVFFDGQRECDWPMYNAQLSRRVYFAGSLAGRRIGTFKDGSNRTFLVTEEAQGVFDPLPKKVEQPEFFSAFLEELLPEEQSLWLCHWLAIALDSLRRQDLRPGQVCVFAGPGGCGKSLLQAIITEIFGGRGGFPFRYMIQETTFNDDFAGTEHWMIEEPKNTTDIRTRIEFGNAIKECAINEFFSLHPKGKRATPVPLWRRLTVSVNDEPELLQVLPPFNGSVEDKISLFHCAKAERTLAQFLDKYGKVDKPRVRAAYVAEMPMIRAWLLKGFLRVPERWRDSRYGLVSFHNKEILSQLKSFAPEVRLMELIDLVLFQADADGGPMASWAGRSQELEKALLNSDYRFETEKILRGANKAGVYLSRLSKLHPERVSTPGKTNGYTTWKIQPPPLDPKPKTLAQAQAF